MMINKRLIGICSESKKYIALTVLTSWISIICNILIILMVGQFINKVYTVRGLLVNLEIDKLSTLLKFKVSLGDHARQIVSGIAKSYPEPEKLVGKKVLAITNLKTVKLRGEVSQGMLLSTEDKVNGLRLVEVDKSVVVGSRAK